MNILQNLKESDPVISNFINSEKNRQETHLELIASENFASIAVMQAQGSVLTNKYAEGLPQKRYYGGCEFVDEIEELAIQRAKKLFNANWANVQPHSGAQANAAVFLSLLKPGDTILGMDLSHGGHLTHGSPVNMSGKWFNAVHYGVNKETSEINFDEKRPNSLDLKDWKNIYKKCLNKKSEEYNEIMYLLKNELDYLENYWPTNIPCGVIHADLFRDNIFFKDEKISGVIDFYFACYYFYIYDLAIVINDWCFSENGQYFNKENCLIILGEYQKLRELSDIEKKSLNILLRAAAVRILCTRVHDYIFHPPDAVVVKKDPFEYLNILRWHQQNDIFE